MEYRRVEIPIDSPVASLCWSGEGSLVDWAGGNRQYRLDGTATNRRVVWTFPFDAAVQSPSGRYAVIYERLGTKAVILDRGEFLRELNRSYYCARSYAYPIVLLMTPDGRELIAHCPSEYNRLEIEDVQTGECLTAAAQRAPADFFHSRLAVSPGGGKLLSAGWIWHPFNAVAVWSVKDAIADGTVLDAYGPLGEAAGAEIDDAAFIDDNRLILSSNSGSEVLDGGDPEFRPGDFGIFDLRRNAFESVATAREPVGEMLWLGEGHFLGLFEHPKVFEVANGRVVLRWPELVTGPRSGRAAGPLPAVALDALGRRFAVASQHRITVIQFL